MNGSLIFGNGVGMGGGGFVCWKLFLKLLKFLFLFFFLKLLKLLFFLLFLLLLKLLCLLGWGLFVVVVLFCIVGGLVLLGGLVFFLF